MRGCRAAIVLASRGTRTTYLEAVSQLLGRVQGGDVHDAPGRQLPEARDPFVEGMVGVEVLALQVFAALPPIVEPDEERPDIVLRAFTDHEAIAC